MKKEEFDELQLSRRYQYGYQSFILLAFLILIHSTLSSFGFAWAKNPTNTIVVLLIGCTYFISKCIWGDALVGLNRTPRRMALTTAAIIIVAIVAAVIAAGYAMIHPSQPATADSSGSMLFLYCCMMWAVIGIVYVIKRVRSPKMEN